MADHELGDIPVDDLRSELLVRENRSNKRFANRPTPENLPSIDLLQAAPGHVDAEGVVAGTRRNLPIERESPQLSGMPSTKIIDELIARQKGLYGADDRRDLHEVTDKTLLRDSMTVAAFFQDEKLGQSEGDWIPVKSQTLQQLRNLCSAEKFSSQPSAAFGSGVLVAEDLVATAGHVVAAWPAKRTQIAFGWASSADGSMPRRLHKDDVYSVKDLVASQYEVRGEDWAVIRLDRPVKNRPVAKLNLKTRIADAQAIHIIGHPVGLPLKVAAGAQVTANENGIYFNANLDAFGGNSGSPVFNSETHEVEGLLISGSPDFVMNVERGCYVSLHCPINADNWEGMCQGENCIRIQVIKDQVSLDRPTVVDRPGSKPQQVQQMEKFAGNLKEFLKGFIGG